MKSRKTTVIVTAYVIGVLLCKVLQADSVTTVSATLQNANPADIVYLADPSVGVPNTLVYAGQLNWVTAPSPSASFSTFCIDIKTDIFLGHTYTYDVENLTSDVEPATAASPKPLSAEQVTQIQELWGKYFSDTTNSNDMAAAFQIDIWCIIYGSGLTITPYNGTGWMQYTPFASSPSTTSWLSHLDPTKSTPLSALTMDASNVTQDQVLVPTTVIHNELPAVPSPSASSAGLILTALIGTAACIKRRKYSHDSVL